MKSIILIVSALIFTSVLMNGQDLKKSEESGRSSENQDKFGIYSEKEGELRIIPDKKDRDLLSEYLKKFNTDSTLTEQYPGASRYYAKRPVFSPYGSSFIRQPDTTNKYYLIIVDPIRHTITK